MGIYITKTGEIDTGIRLHSSFTDSWHLCKSLMIILLCLSVVLYTPLFGTYIDFVLFGIAWNLSFSLHYNIVFKIK